MCEWPLSMDYISFYDYTLKYLLPHPDRLSEADMLSFWKAETVDQVQ